MWDNAPKLTVQAEVPNPGNFLWAGYIGKTSDITLRSVYDNQNIYFLVEWTAPEQSVIDRPWYFNPTTKLWARESQLPVFDENGNKSREAFNEDKFAFLWNINKSTKAFENLSCYATCHMNSATTVGAAASGGNHWTNLVTERIDMWHYHLVKDSPYNQLSDEYQDWGGGTNNTNGRKRDNQLNATDGTTTNTQNLAVTGGTTTVAVPKWVIPNAANQKYILANDTLSGGAARLITSVNTEGVLTFNGGFINPNTDAEYQRFGNDAGRKAISSIMISPFTGSRADITAKATYTGKGYVAEIKRKLKTDDKANQDVDFSSFEDKVFGVAVFNRADIAHAIKPDLVLKFQK
jgi:Ethylbenzene dehydrogenase